MFPHCAYWNGNPDRYTTNNFDISWFHPYVQTIPQCISVYNPVSLCSFRCGSVHRDGVQNGPKLQVQVTEAFCSREVSAFSKQIISALLMIHCSINMSLCQVHELLPDHLSGHLAVWGCHQHHPEVRLAGWKQVGRAFLQPKDRAREKQQPG